MKKTYEKPTLEIITFDYDVQAEESAGIAEWNIGDWWGNN